MPLLESQNPALASDAVPLPAALFEQNNNTVEKATDELKLQRLYHWYRERGINAPGLEVRVENGRRGVFARTAIIEGELLIHVPRSTIVTPDVARASPIGKHIEAAKVQLTDNGLIAAFLLQQKRENGPWQPYIDVMPLNLEYFSTLPIFFPKSDLAMLKGSCVPRIAKDWWYWHVRDFKRLNRCLPKNQRFSLADFVAARAFVISRVFKLSFNNVETRGLVPFADMLNHAENGDAGYVIDASRGFLMLGKRQIGVGTEIHTVYGKRSNVTLFNQYGFCLDHNPADATDIRFIKLEPSHAFADMANELGERKGNERLFHVDRSYTEKMTQQMFSFLRLGCLADLPVLVRHAVNPKCDFKCIPPLSQKNEAGALSWLATACESRLREFDTSIEEDEKILQATGLSDKYRLACMVRRSEKRVLLDYIELAKETIPLLELPKRALAEALEKRVQAKHVFAEYFSEVAKHLCPAPSTQGKS